MTWSQDRTLGRPDAKKTGRPVFATTADVTGPLVSYADDDDRKVNDNVHERGSYRTGCWLHFGCAVALQWLEVPVTDRIHSG